MAKKSLYSKILIALILLFIVAFTVAVLKVFDDTGSEPVVLIGFVFGLAGTELALIRSIKKDKTKAAIAEKKAAEKSKRTLGEMQETYNEEDNNEN